MMKNKSLTFHFFLLIYIFSFQGSTNAQITCHASAPARVGVGETFEYKISLNEKPSSISSTSFSQFKVIGGPHQGSSSSVSIINGQTKQTQSFYYSYYLQADKTGIFTIPGTVFIVNGKQVKSNNVSVTVVEAASGAAQGNRPSSSANTTSPAPSIDKNDIFIKAYASKSNPYQGEQVIITYKLYIGPSINGGFQTTNINLPNQSGLWSYQLGDPQADAKRSTETIDGKRYTVFEVRKTAVFPQKSGEIVITPLEMDIIARVIYQAPRGNSIWDQFFGGGQQAKDHKLNIKSNSVKLSVKPLPETGKPDPFSGLAGSFTISSHLSRNELKANDATNLTITISGNGNLQHIEALDIKFPPDFDVTEPKISDNINTMGNSVNGSRHFEYVIIPRNHGEFTIPSAVFSYFDISTKTYKTIHTEEFSLNVEKGDTENNLTSTFSNQKEIKMLDRDIRYIKTNGNAFHKVRSSFFLSPWYFTLLSIPLFLFLLFLFLRKKYVESRSDLPTVRDKKANKTARKRLHKAHRLLENNHVEEFYVEISRVLWGYISDKFRLHLSQLSLETVEAKLKEKKINAETIQEFMNTLQQCEFARFAPGDSTRLMQEMYERTLSFITNIEKK